MTMTRSQRDKLFRLAERFGIQRSYLSMERQRNEASPEAVQAVLKILGLEITLDDDFAALDDEIRHQLWAEKMDKTAIAWDGTLTFEMRFGAQEWPEDIPVTLELEDGNVRSEVISTAGIRAASVARVGEGSVIGRKLQIEDVPLGYHRLRVELPELDERSVLVISAPKLAYQASGMPAWGFFLPAYAIRSHAPGHWGAGNFTDLGNYVRWVRGQGGSIAGTLPMLATFLDEPFDPSPYAPISRLFWNPFMIDATQEPEFQQSESIRAMVASRDVQATIERLRELDLVDYGQGMRLRRSVLERMAAECFASDNGRRNALEAWVAGHHRAAEYARFMTMVECFGPDREAWGLSDPQYLPDESPDLERERYHLYSQWIADQQIAELSDSVRDGISGLYLDLPIGVHPAGYDAWRYQHHFAKGVAVGSPPDAVHDGGQNWGLAPLHPKIMEDEGFSYFRAVLQHNMQYASVLRIDHVMGLQRQFWIPDGFDGADGVYVRYPMEPLYALVTLESQRHQTVIVGEDLGTVPPETPKWMEEHGLFSITVLPFRKEMKPEEIGDLPVETVASLNTHDMPTFRMLWTDLSDEQRDRMLDAFRLAGFDVEDETCVEEALEHALELLAGSQAKMLMINLEDLWLESHQQNVPGTTLDEYPNWQFKSRYALEELDERPEVKRGLEIIRRGRARAGSNCQTPDDDYRNAAN